MKAPAECETWTYWWVVKGAGPQPLASIWVWSWDPLRFVRRHPPHHLSPAEQTTRQGAIPWGASAAPKPAQQRSDQGRKPVISEQIVAGRAKILPSVSWVLIPLSPPAGHSLVSAAARSNPLTINK